MTTPAEVNTQEKWFIAELAELGFLYEGSMKCGRHRWLVEIRCCPGWMTDLGYWGLAVVAKRRRQGMDLALKLAETMIADANNVSEKGERNWNHGKSDILPSIP